MRYAILDSNDVVVNIVVWDGNLESWQPPQDMTAVLDDTEPYQYILQSVEPTIRPHWKPSVDSPYRFGIERSDRDSFSAHLSLITLAKSKGLLTDETQTQFIDADGTTIHSVSVEEYESMLLGYGLYMQSLAFGA